MEKIIQIDHFKMNYEQNGYAHGLVLKRKLTFNEANHITNNILGINTRLTFDDLEGEELKDAKNQLITDVYNLLAGEIGFDVFNDDWACGEAYEDFRIALLFDMLLYLSDRKII